MNKQHLSLLLLILLSLSNLSSSATKLNPPTINDFLQDENKTSLSNKQNYQQEQENVVAENDKGDKLHMSMKKAGAGGGHGGGRAGTAGGGSSNAIHHPNNKPKKNGASMGIIHPLNSFIFTFISSFIASALFFRWI